MYRYRDDSLEVLLVHPGGPFWKGKDERAWSIPKGEYQQDEEPLEAAKREFWEETGIGAEGLFSPLSTLKQPGGKKITAWAFEGDCDASSVKSNTFSMEWPPRSGKQAEFPEVDKAAWFAVNEARDKLVKGQVAFVDELCDLLRYVPEDRNTNERQ
jgi:predicted NUDIX family NTP pyrophosphohydrolase